MNVNGGRSRSSSTTLSSCQSECVNDAQCTAIDWNDATIASRRCWHHGPWSAGNTRNRRSGVDHYELTRNSQCSSGMQVKWFVSCRSWQLQIWGLIHVQAGYRKRQWNWAFIFVLNLSQMAAFVVVVLVSSINSQVIGLKDASKMIYFISKRTQNLNSSNSIWIMRKCVYITKCSHCSR